MVTFLFLDLGGIAQVTELWRWHLTPTEIFGRKRLSLEQNGKQLFKGQEEAMRSREARVETTRYARATGSQKVKDRFKNNISKVQFNQLQRSLSITVSHYSQSNSSEDDHHASSKHAPPVGPPVHQFITERARLSLA